MFSFSFSHSFNSKNSDYLKLLLESQVVFMFSFSFSHSFNSKNTDYLKMLLERQSINSSVGKDMVIIELNYLRERRFYSSS